MTETTNYGLKLMERADSGNWITGGLNSNTTKIDEVMKRLSNQLTDANSLITGLQNQLDTTNGSMTAQGGQITELGNLISRANGNITTLTQAVEDLQTKQPTFESGEEIVGSCAHDTVYGAIRFTKLGKIVFADLLISIKRDSVSDPTITLDFDLSTTNGKYEAKPLSDFKNTPFSEHLESTSNFVNARKITIDSSLSILARSEKMSVTFIHKACEPLFYILANGGSGASDNYGIYHKEFYYISL